MSPISGYQYIDSDSKGNRKNLFSKNHSQMTIANDKNILFKVNKHVTEFKVVISTVFKEEF